MPSQGFSKHINLEAGFSVQGGTLAESLRWEVGPREGGLC